MALDGTEYLNPISFISSSAASRPEGLASKQRFLVDIIRSGSGIGLVGPLFNYMNDAENSLRWNAMSASVPGISMEIGSTTVGQRPRFHATERSDQDLQITFLESSDMPIRRFFTDWIGLIWSPYSTVRNYPDEYTLAGIKVWALTPQGTGEFYDEFQEIFPYEVADLDWDVSSSDLVMTQVKFKFRVHIAKQSNDGRTVKI